MTDIKDGTPIRIEYESGAVLTGPARNTAGGGLAVSLTDGYAVMFVRDFDGRPAHGVVSYGPVGKKS
ncbi:hypothetical protein [Bifidobacterium callitrichidarum]|uniref:Uncharacterized protein n=1 Tax=Bifidobacterium callitrichidarum TaxID=2052941 RepID=A0A2U2N8X0_9BIFI|nr:hypothetical protein [Bifidobacterium callitrichidarum]PWG65616.1 hypothetical protein DF196_06700 [Bifidobacterium callitrichidarum]